MLRPAVFGWRSWGLYNGIGVEVFRIIRARCQRNVADRL